MLKESLTDLKNQLLTTPNPHVLDEWGQIIALFSEIHQKSLEYLEEDWNSLSDYKKYSYVSNVLTEQYQSVENTLSKPRYNFLELETLHNRLAKDSKSTLTIDNKTDPSLDQFIRYMKLEMQSDLISSKAISQFIKFSAAAVKLYHDLLVNELQRDLIDRNEFLVVDLCCRINKYYSNLISGIYEEAQGSSLRNDSIERARGSSKQSKAAENTNEKRRQLNESLQEKVNKIVGQLVFRIVGRGHYLKNERPNLQALIMDVKRIANESDNFTTSQRRVLTDNRIKGLITGSANYKKYRKMRSDK